MSEKPFAVYHNGRPWISGWGDLCIETANAAHEAEVKARVEEALKSDRLKRVEMIRCQGPSDILVVDNRGMAEDIAGNMKNACHSHTIMVRADYEAEKERAVREAVEATWAKARDAVWSVICEGDDRRIVRMADSAICRARSRAAKP